MVKRTIAVVVTHNRKELLKECLTAILSGKTKPVEILVVDNHSTDGTEAMLAENFSKHQEIRFLGLDKNTGGAGGFYYGIKEAVKDNPDFIWIMDDDTVPEREALSSFYQAADDIGDFGFLCSSVTDPRGKMTSIPSIDDSRKRDEYAQWNLYLEHGYVKVKASTFVSVLLPADAVRNVGLPIKEYFLWGDDTEYTNRISRYYKSGFIVGHSRVLHKKDDAKPFDISDEKSKGRIRRYHLYFRNSLFNSKAYNTPRAHLRYFGSVLLKQPLLILLKGGQYRIAKWFAVNRGIGGYLFNRRLRKIFKNRMKYL